MADDRTTKRVKIKDDYGGEHDYLIIAHPSGKGWPLLLRLLKVGGKAFNVTVSGSPSKVAAELGEMIDKYKSMMETEVSKSGIGNLVFSLAADLLESPEIVSGLFAHTARDRGDLSRPDDFDSAFQANYGELVFAIVEVIKLNYGPLLSRLLGGASVLQGLGASLSTAAQKL